MKTIRRAFHEAPFTVAVFAFCLLWIIAWVTYGLITDGWSYLLWLGVFVAVYGGFRLLANWAERKDGIDR